MASLFSALKKSSDSSIGSTGGKEINWDAFEKELTDKVKAKEYCELCKDIDWQDQDELNVCKACGTVIERPLDMGAEYRFFSADDRGGGDPCRVGPPIDPRFADSSLGTIILGVGHGGHASARGQMLRIRRFHTWSMFPYKKRSLLMVFDQMSLAAVNHGIELRVIEIAKDLYMSLVEHCEKRGLSRGSIIASCIYSALKMVGAPRKPKDVADIFHLQNAQFTKAFKEFQCVLAMAKQKGMISESTIIPSQLKTTHASDYIAFPLSKLPVGRAHMETLKQLAMKVSDIVEEEELSKENMPPSLASAVLAFVLHRSGYDKITTAEIASACDVSEGTLMKCLRRLEQSEDILKAKGCSIVKKLNDN
jgi:transcription initiation factor TFIIIB Brf1 subunit/transcription initiation factor TFIIB